MARTLVRIGFILLFTNLLSCRSRVEKIVEELSRLETSSEELLQIQRELPSLWNEALPLLERCAADRGKPFARQQCLWALSVHNEADGLAILVRELKLSLERGKTNEWGDRRFLYVYLGGSASHVSAAIPYLEELYRADFLGELEAPWIAWTLHNITGKVYGTMENPRRFPS